MKKQALISVIISCYNHEKYIQQCIMSVLNQSYKNVELIVVDDGSQDNSFPIIERLSKAYNFFAVKQNNLGLAASLNKAIHNYAHGDWVCCLASDDVWEITKLQQQADFVHAYPQYSLVCGKARYMDENGLMGSEVEFGLKRDPNYTFDQLLIENKIVALTVMFKKDTWLTIGGYDEKSFIEDWDMWLSVSNQYEIGFQNVIMGYWRLHNNNSSNDHIKMSTSKMYIVNKWKGHPLYKQAYEKHFLETIRTTARNHKGFTVLNMAKHLQFVYKAAYIKALFKLMLFW